MKTLPARAKINFPSKLIIMVKMSFFWWLCGTYLPFVLLHIVLFIHNDLMYSSFSKNLSAMQIGQQHMNSISKQYVIVFLCQQNS